jgi:pimeloyl-ACP methyl ester carboxylesterase
VLFAFVFLASIASPSADAFFDSNGVRIRYVVTGRGEPVVLIHGWAASAEMWDPLVEELSKSYEVIALDCRGHGQSGKPHDPKQYGVEMANDVVRLLDHLHIRKANVVGYSMGGGIALKMLVDHSDRFLTAVIGGSEGFRKGVGPGWDDENFIRELESGMSLSDAMIANAPADRPTPTPEQRAMMKQMDASQDPKALAAQRRGNTGLEIDDAALKAIHVPVLVVVGSRDNPDRVKALVAALPDARLDVIEGAGHGSATDSPQFVKDVREFLDRHAAAYKKAA